jgi:hypothetical protein
MLWLAGKQVEELKKVEESKSRKVEELTSTPRLVLTNVVESGLSH